MSLQSTTEQTFTTSETLKPYVPLLVIEWLREHGNERHRLVEGSLAFTDISGFTQLTERLSRKGKVGAEEMNDLLNSCFTELLSVAYDFGARVIKWGGDAVLLLFTGAGHEARACRGALEMQKTIGTVGKRVAMPSGVKLRMSVGIHSGLIDFFLVGDLHRELVVTGPAATMTVATEAVADAGQVAVTPATAAALAPGRVGERKGDVFLLKDEPDVVPDRTPPIGDVSDIDLRTCLPVEVGAYLSTGGGDAEHRPMTAAFIHFTGVDDLLESEGPDALADALETCLGSVQRIAHDHRVSFFETDIAPNGGKIMLMAGAPSSAGNDEERMLRAMRAVLDDEPSLPMRIGVNQGRIFVSDFGPPYRRTYSVKGDAVNLAARLMARAEPGQLLATDTVLDRSRTSFETLALPPFQAKGKSEPVLAYAVGKPLRGVERGDETVLIGRKRELAMLLDGLAGARLSEGRLVEIVAEPGMGKSTLLATVRREAPDVRSLTVQCDEYEASTPYHPLHGLLRELLELAPHDGAEELEAVLSRRAPHLTPWLPLIATVLGLEARDTPETAALDEQFRKQQLERHRRRAARDPPARVRPC